MDTRGNILGTIAGIGAVLYALSKLPAAVRFLVLWILLAILLNPISFFKAIILPKEPVAAVIPVVGSVEYYTHRGVDDLEFAEHFAEHYDKTGKLIIIVERQKIVDALKRTNGDSWLAAKDLGIGYNLLCRRMGKFGVDPDNLD